MLPVPVVVPVNRSILSQSVVLPRPPISLPIAIPPPVISPTVPIVTEQATLLIPQTDTPVRKGPGRPMKYNSDEERAQAKKDTIERTRSKPFVEVVMKLREEIDEMRNEIYIQSVRINKLFQLLEDSRYDDVSSRR